MGLYAAIMRLNATIDRAVVIKAPSLTEALRKVDTMRGNLIAIAPLVSNQAYLEVIEDAAPRVANSK